MRKRKLISVSVYIGHSRNEDQYCTTVHWYPVDGYEYSQNLGTFYSKIYELNGPLAFPPVKENPQRNRRNQNLNALMGGYGDETFRMTRYDMLYEARMRPTSTDWRVKIALQRKLQVVRSLFRGLDDKVKIALWTAFFVTIFLQAIRYVA